MNPWSRRTLELVREQNYLDRLQAIYSHEDGQRNVSEETLSAIRRSFESGDHKELLNQLLNLERFPYKDSYVGFLRRDRSAMSRNPETVARICDRLYNMGLEQMIQGIVQAKEANTRRGNQFSNWMKSSFPSLPPDEFVRSREGIVLLKASEMEFRHFSNTILGAGLAKRPDIVAKTGTKYILGEAKFLSSTGGNQGRAFHDGITLASNTAGRAHKVFVLDGVLWLENKSAQFLSIASSSAVILSALLLREYLKELERE